MVLPSFKLKLEDGASEADRKPQLQHHVKSEKRQEDNLPALPPTTPTPDLKEEAAKTEDSKCAITSAGKPEKNQEDHVPDWLEGVKPSLGPMRDPAEVEDSKTGVLAVGGDPGVRDDDHHHGTEPRDPGARLDVPDVIIRDGKALATIEVVLPRWKDVLRRKSRRARSEARHMEEQMPAHPGGMNREATALAEQLGIKREPVEDPEFRVFERYNPGPVEVAQAIQEMRNPDVKVKKELLLNDDYLLDALTWEGINNRYPIPVPPDIAEFPFPRAYIHHLYGGGHQVTFPEPNKDLIGWHGLKDWAFLTLEWNPHAPTRPGFSGLFFTRQPATTDWEDIMRTFVRVRSGRWVYMGQYKFGRGKSLTAESWRQQSAVVRRTWAKGYIKMSGSDLCVRVWLRKQRGSDCKITEEDYEAAEPKMKEIQASITEEDINGALDRGEEELGVYTMTCVGYDEEFIRFLERNVHRWDPPAPKNKQAAAPGTVGNKFRKGTGSKRKPIELDSDDDSVERSGGAGEPWVQEGDDKNAKLANSSAQEPERRSTRERVKRVRIS